MPITKRVFCPLVLVAPIFLCLIVTPTEAQNGPDALLVGGMTLTSYSAINSLIPLPAFPNQKFCSLVTLAPNTVVWAYVPTANERNGNFSAFTGKLIDPVNNTQFPLNIIPPNRQPQLFAWRLAPSGPAAGEPCLQFPSAISFRWVGDLQTELNKSEASSTYQRAAESASDPKTRARLHAKAAKQQ